MSAASSLASSLAFLGCLQGILGKAFRNDQSGKCLDIGGGIQIRACSGDADQLWLWDDGALKNPGSGQCLDITGGSNMGYVDGTKIGLYFCNGLGNQQWLWDNGALKNPESGKCLDITGGGSADGTTLDLWPCNGGGNQQWEESSFVSPSMLAAWQIDLLDQHNLYRCIHDIPAYSWDADVAASAQAWADKGVFAHSGGISGNGENIAAGYPLEKDKDVVRGWYSEIKGSSPYGVEDDSAWMTVGHYSQVVWKKSVKLGCGFTKTGIGTYDFYVCQYSPSGNYAGEWPQNVLPAKKSPTACGGTAEDVPADFPTNLLASDWQSSGKSVPMAMASVALMAMMSAAMWSLLGRRCRAGQSGISSNYEPLMGVEDAH